LFNQNKFEIMNLKRSLGKKDGKKKPVMEKHVLTNAYVLTAETGDVIRTALEDIPCKYKNIPFIIQFLETLPRANVTIQLPKGQSVPTLVKGKPQPGQAPAEAPKPEEPKGDE
jgi:hypothetical protein